MDSLANLTAINLDDLVSSFGWQDSPRLAALVRGIFHAPAQKFARQMLDFDAEVGKQGLALAAQALFEQFARSLQIFGAEYLSQSGPTLFLSNHPGMIDTLALFMAIQRADLRILAIERPFLKALSNTSRQLIFLNDDPTRRMAAIKTTATHLKAGGAALTFPAGKIDPDPAVYPGAIEALSEWSDSAGVFARFAPGTKVIPTLVSGVLWEKAVKHPLTYIKKTRFEREKLGAALQLLAHIQFNQRPLHVRVQFGQPIVTDGMDSREIHANVLEQMQSLIQNQM